MTREQFTQQFGRLIATYQQKDFPPERVAIMFDTVKDLSAEWFERFVKNCISDMRYAPLVSDFREAAYKERQATVNNTVIEAAHRWEAGEYQGLNRMLEASGVKSLKEAVELERRKLR